MIIYNQLNFKSFNTLRINTLIEYMFEVINEQEIFILQFLFNYFDIKYYVIGNASKVLFSQEYIKRPIIYINKSFSNLYISKDKLIVSSGYKLDKLIINLAKMNISIFENLYPIPATIGGALAMNAGDNQSSISDNLYKVIVLDKNNNIKVLNKKECLFSYRHSNLKDKYIILYAIFFINKKEYNEILKTISNSLKYRSIHQPTNINSCGSLFKNTKKYKAYEVISKLNLKNICFGNAKLASKHCNFLDLSEETKAIDVINLIKFIQKNAKNQLNIDLDPEIVLY